MTKSLTGLNIGSFPSTDHLMRGKWAPIYFEPIPGSGERLTIAIIVVGNSGFEIVVADRLSALGCMYPNDYERVHFFVRAAIETVRASVEKRGLEVLMSGSVPMSGVYLGKAREGMGDNLKSIAETWLHKSSSLVSHGYEEAQIQDIDKADPVEVPRVAHAQDRLPLVVYDGVMKKNPFLSSYFRTDIREGLARRPRHASGIDYCGKKLVANFCTLRAARASVSYVNNTLKPPLWDLRAFRDTHSEFSRASFELHIQSPASYDTQFTEREHRRAAEALANLHYEAKKADITLRSYTSPAEIVGRIIELEAA